MKLTPRKIAIIILFIVFLYISVSAIFDAYLKLDQEWRDFASVIGFSIFGIFLIFMRKISNKNQYLIESVEVLILLIVPTVASFRLLAINDLGKNLLGGIIVVIDVIWFAYFYFFGKNTGEEVEFQQARKIILIVFLEILFMGILTFGFVVSILHL